MAFEDELSEISDFPSWTEIEPLRSASGYDEGAAIKSYLDRTEKITEGVTRIKILPPAAEPSAESLYLVKRNDGKRLLLRTRPISDYERMRAEAVFANRIIREGLVLTLPPVEIAACRADTLCYSLYGYIETVNGADFLRSLAMPEQFAFGVKCGRMLKKIHGIKPDGESFVNGVNAFEQRLGSALERIERTKTEFRGLNETKRFLSEATALLKDRPQTMLHGNFLPQAIFVYGELPGIYTPENAFCGDPYSDFGKICTALCRPFMRGQLSGYFAGGVPNGFFDLLAVYCAENALELIANARSPQKKLFAIRMAEKTAADFDFYQTTLPRWYR